MAACTFALSPSSANVVACKRTVLRLRHQADARAAPVAREHQQPERRGTSRKGPNGKAFARGKSILKAIPCARYSSVDGTVCVKNQANQDHASVVSPKQRQRPASPIIHATFGQR